MVGHVKFGCVVACIHLAAGCWGFPRPADVGAVDDGPICAADQALRCDGTDLLVRCNSDGTAEVSEPCLLGCSASALRCNDVDPSNGLAPYLDLTVGEPDLDLGAAATINTDDGTVMADGKSVVVKSTVLAQTSGPSIRIFIVHSLTTADVTITGRNAFAVVSHGDLKIGGVFAASADFGIPGAGAFNDGACKGGDMNFVANGGESGAGGGGFGATGGRGGTATSDNGTATGGAGGMPTGTATLIPLRGGCDSGTPGNNTFGAGGGAMQLVSRTKVTITGVVAANGDSVIGGGSGGGILLEAPVVDVTGSVVANGGAGAGGCIFPRAGEDGRLDAIPAAGGIGCPTSGVDGGNGGAGNIGAGNGASINAVASGGLSAFAGAGGGSVGRIRVNTASGGFNRTGGLFSPNPSTGAIVTR